MKIETCPLCVDPPCGEMVISCYCSGSDMDEPKIMDQTSVKCSFCRTPIPKELIRQMKFLYNMAYL